MADLYELLQQPTVQPTPQPQTKPGIANYTSEAASILGGLLGSIAGPGGTIVGSGAGASLGQLLENKLTGKKDSALKEGAMGAGGAVLGLGVGKLLGGAAKAGSGLRSSVVKPTVQASPFAANEEKAIVNALKQLGIKGSAQAQREQVPEVFKRLSGQIDEVLSASKKTVSKASVKKDLMTALQESINFDDTIPAYKGAANKFINQIAKGNAKLTAKEIYTYKQSLNKQLSRAFDKLEKGTPLTPQEEVGLTVWENIDKLIAKTAPEAKDLTRLQSFLFKASPGLQKSAKEQIKFFGAEIPGASGTIQTTKDAVGRLLEGTGGSNLLGQATQQGIGQVGVRSMFGNAPAMAETQLNDPTMAQDQFLSESDTNAPLDNDLTQNNTQYDKEYFTQAIFNDFAQTGGKNVDKILKVAEYLSPKEDKVDAAAKKEQSKISGAEIIANQIESALTEAGGTRGRIGGTIKKGKSAIGVDAPATAYEAIRKASIAPLARAISGEVGVLTDMDIARAEQLLPKLTDTPEEARLKLKNLRSTISQKKSNISTSSTDSVADLLNQLSQL